MYSPLADHLLHFLILGSNYAPTFVVQDAAAREGCDQVLWVQGRDRALAEVAAMNIFLVLRGP